MFQNIMKDIISNKENNMENIIQNFCNEIFNNGLEIIEEHIDKIKDKFPSEIKDILIQGKKDLKKLYDTKHKIAKSVIVGRYRNSKVSLNSLIGINKIYDDCSRQSSPNY